MEAADRRSHRPLLARIRTLERRLDHLRRRAADDRRRRSSRDFDQAEIGALEDAIAALSRYRAEWQLGTSAVELLQKLRTALALPEMGPIYLADVVDVLEDVDQLLAEISAAVKA